MSKETAVVKFASAKAAVAEHIEANKPVFNAHQNLVMNLIDAENELRDAVAESDTGISEGTVTVTREPQTQVVLDEEKILATLGITREQAVERGLIQINQRPPRITIHDASTKV